MAEVELQQEVKAAAVVSVVVPSDECSISTVAAAYIRCVAVALVAAATALSVQRLQQR